MKVTQVWVVIVIQKHQSEIFIQRIYGMPINLKIWPGQTPAVSFQSAIQPVYTRHNIVYCATAQQTTNSGINIIEKCSVNEILIYLNYIY